MKLARLLTTLNPLVVPGAKTKSDACAKKATVALVLGYSTLVAGSLFAVKRNENARAKENALHPKDMTQDDAYILAIGSKRI